MSIKYFSGLSEQEVESLIAAPAKITVLIAGADGSISARETETGSKLVNYRRFTADVVLHDYYEAVDKGFESALKAALKTFRADPIEGLNHILADLKALNPILAKLNRKFATEVAQSWRSLARKVAESHGGIAGFWSIDENEQKLMVLPMIEY